MVELYRRHPLMFGYYVWDEPYPQQYPMAREQVDRIQGCDPEHIAYTVALPSYNERYRWDNGKFEEYLREYARVIQPSVLALDYYPFFWEAVTPQDLDRSQLYNDIGLLRRIALEQDTPMWFYFQCWPHVQKERQMTGAQVRCQLYNALLYGAKGLQYYIIYPYIVTPEGEKGCLFDQVKELNHEVRALRNTLLALTSRRVYHGGEVNDRFAQSWEEDPVLAKLEDGFSAGRFDDGYGNDYLLWQNRDFERAKTGCLTLRRPMRVYEVDKKDGATGFWRTAPPG